MLRGYQRKLIMIRTDKSELFESAFFILKSEASVKQASNEMISEANKILEECNLPKKKTKSVAFKHIFITSAISFVLGAALVGGIWAMLTL